MIVRDEAHVVRETLDSVAAHIDYWVVVDTGSVDATVKVVRSHMAAKGLPGEVHERPWRDFGANRTEALELCAGKADYIWVIDADDLVVGTLDLSCLCADSYLLRYGDEFRYWRKQLFRDGLRWRFEGAVHEYPVCDDPATEERLGGDYYIQSRRLGFRSFAADKYERDCALLREALERDPADARSAFYLAQSYFDGGNYAQALEWYTRRAEMGGWGEEVFYSILRRGACLTALDAPWESALSAYLEAWQARPARAEPLYEIARHYRLADAFELGYLFAKRAVETPDPERESLFVAVDVYGWRAADELAICAYYTGRYEESFELSTTLLEGSGLPETERARVEANRGCCVRWIADQRSAYPAELVERITERVADDGMADAEVTLTVTSCRRPVLFERTINSFLCCCTDVERIGRWICVDCGSADVDRARMRELYPFFEFIYGDPESMHHSDSMNLLLEAVASPFWLHLEDDWQFFWRGTYVERSLAILADDETIAQVAFNRNYGETLDCARIIGGEVRQTVAQRLRYRVHEHIGMHTPEWEEHLNTLPAGSLSVAYWPHFTLRPSLVRTGSIRSVGRFDPGPGHFELEFAERYAAVGLQTAFFDAINCLHTGRLTSERRGEGRLSAYELVGDREHPARPRHVETSSVIDESLGIWVINLDRRADRWNSFQATMSSAAGAGFAERCRRFEAIDGRELHQTSEIRRLFRGNDFALRRGIVGCALSHISIWRSIAARGDDVLELVLEDDVRPSDRFDRRLAALLGELRDAHPTFDLVFLGYFANGSAPGAAAPDGPRSRPMRWQRYLGGAFAYLLSGRGAKRLVDLVERDGVQNGIDTFVMLKRAELQVLECDPPLAVSPVAPAGSDVDSDIQHDFVSVAARPAATVGGPPRNGCIRLGSVVPSLSVAEVRLDVEPDWPCSGATIASDHGGFRAIVRTSGDLGREVATVNYVVSFDQSFEIEGVEPLADRAPPGPAGRCYDGCRLVCLGDEWVASALECSPGAASRPVLLHLDGAAILAAERLHDGDGDSDAPPAPFAADGLLRLVTSWSPTRVRGRDRDGAPFSDLALSPTPGCAHSLSVGSSGVPVQGGWLFLVSDAAAAAHRAVLLDDQYVLVAASRPFAIIEDGEEHCWGLALRDGQLVIAFGVGGRAAGLAVLGTEEALALLEPCR